VMSTAFTFVLKLVLGMREITNWTREEKRTVLWRLQRRACHGRVVVMLLAGTEVSVDWERFPHFLRVRRGVDEPRSRWTRFPRRRWLLLRLRAGCDRQVAGNAITHWMDAPSLLLCL